MSKKHFTSAIILAAGDSVRFGSDEKKQFAEVCKIPCVIRSIMAFDECPEINEIILVCAPGENAAVHTLCDKYPIGKLTKIVEGGSTRQKSAMNGFNAIDDRSKYVAIHDAARCLVTAEIISAVIAFAYKNDAAIAAQPVTSTVKVSDRDGFIAQSADRESIWLAATPQVFLTNMYRAGAYIAERDEVCVTDDAMLVERIGFRVALVDCGNQNIKLTTREDIQLAEAIINARRTERPANGGTV